MINNINWNPNSKDLKKFCLTTFIGFTIIAVVLLVLDKPSLTKNLWSGNLKDNTALWLFIVGFVLLVLGHTLPVITKPFYYFWMGIAAVMGTCISYLLLSLIYFLFVSPVALFFKITGRDPLNRQKTAVDSYWTKPTISADKEMYHHQF